MAVIASRRLDLTPLTIEALEALIAGNREALEAASGARFPEPLAAPPLMDDALPHFRDVLRAAPGAGLWGSWLIVLRETGEAVGSAGFTGGPDAGGSVTLGYSVYPSHQRRGIAAEAAAALVNWALTQPGIRRVRATIPPWHVASQRVAEHAGLHRTELAENDPDDGPVEIWATRTGET